MYIYIYISYGMWPPFEGFAKDLGHVILGAGLRTGPNS